MTNFALHETTRCRKHPTIDNNVLDPPFDGKVAAEQLLFIAEEFRNAIPNIRSYQEEQKQLQEKFDEYERKWNANPGENPTYNRFDSDAQVIVNTSVAAMIRGAGNGRPREEEEEEEAPVGDRSVRARAIVASGSGKGVIASREDTSEESVETPPSKKRARRD